MERWNETPPLFWEMLNLVAFSNRRQRVVVIVIVIVEIVRRGKME